MDCSVLVVAAEVGIIELVDVVVVVTTLVVLLLVVLLGVVVEVDVVVCWVAPTVSHTAWTASAT